MNISEIRITAASPADRDAGLIAFVSCTYGEIEIDGIAIRKTVDGRIIVTFPARQWTGCRRKYFITPRSVPVRRAFEEAILSEFRRAHA